MSSSDETEVVLTPLKGIEPGSHVMRIERLLASQLNKANVKHFAGGPYQGIIINKATQEETSTSKPDAVRMFTAYVADPKKNANDFAREKRVLKFWFEELAKVDKQVTEAITDTFFKELMNPDAFPKDYINFVKRVLNLVKQYSAVQKLELIMRKLLEGEGDEGMVMHRTLHMTRTVVTSTKVTTIKGQDEFIRQADGSIVDTHGNVIMSGTDAAKVETGQVLIMKNGHIQEDYRRLADGTIVDSHGDIVTGDVQVMMMQPGGILTRYQQEYVTNGIENGFEPNATSTTKRGQLKKQPTITRKGWDLIWATKKQRLIQILEDAYPTVMTMDDLVSHSYMKKADVEYLMDDLTKRGLVKDVDKNRFIRIPEGRKLVIRQGTTQRSSRQSADLDSTLDRSTLNRSMDEESRKKRHEFKLVAHIPHLPAKDQPVIAIVTLLFCEKVAVDAMMDSKTTFIRIKKGEGEGQVYTVGKIGPHIVVSTKLSRIGHGEAAMMAAGNTVTRLLGTFGQIEHVILVGVGGGVLSLDDDSKHVRLGDIVASKVEKLGEPAYIHSNEAQAENDGKTTFKTKAWTPKDLILEKIMMSLKRKSTEKFFSGEWDKYIEEGYEELSGGDTKYSRPPPESDKVYKVEANKEIELQHPKSPLGSARARDPSKPVLFLGKIGAGKNFSKNDALRQAFITSNDCLCVDSGFQAVMQSIEGNRKDSFAVIRGISDYQDGTHRREWQPYASLVAAAFMKAVILQLSHEEDEDDD